MMRFKSVRRGRMGKVGCSLFFSLFFGGGERGVLWSGLGLTLRTGV